MKNKTKHKLQRKQKKKENYIVNENAVCDKFPHKQILLDVERFHFHDSHRTKFWE